MTSQASAAASQPAFELKGRMATLTILRVLNADLDRFLDELDRRLAGAPDLFNGMPVVLDLSAVSGEALVDAAWLSELSHHLWQHEMAPLAVLAGDGRMEDVGRAAGLGVMRLPGSDTRREEQKAEPAAEESEPAVQAGRVITQPVRSGQQIYARGGDLVVLSSVSPGAEVLADGNIHIYGNLRGRALAGVQGNREARIFCQRLNAELVAVAGCYQVSEHMADADRGQPVQIFLRDDALCIAPLPSG
ncbi:MAG: septum site-determining protein MinC [Ectothiorhodospiraceae bacterium]|jgi:septum site-determining protein MinC